MKYKSLLLILFSIQANAQVLASWFTKVFIEKGLDKVLDGSF